MRSGLPAWASFFSPSAFKLFLRCVEDELRSRGLAYELGDGCVVLTDSGITLGLVNLAQRCHASLPPRWPGLVTYLVDQVLAAANQDALIHDLVAEPARGRPRLRLQLQSDAYMENLQHGDMVAVRRPWGLWTCVSWDLPTSVSIVMRRDIAPWGLSDDALLELGLQNVRADEPVERDDLEGPSGLRAYALGGSSHFAASHALLLGEAVQRALVWIPNRHGVLVAPLGEREDAGPMLAWLGPRAARAFRDGPGSISPLAYGCLRGILGDLV